MRVLIDECIDERFRNALSVSSVKQLDTPDSLDLRMASFSRLLKKRNSTFS